MTTDELQGQPFNTRLEYARAFGLYGIMRYVLQKPERLAAETLRRVDAVWQWWLDEITQMLPRRWAGHTTLVAEMSGESFVFIQEDMQGQAVETQKPAGRNVNLRLGNEAVLRRTLSLPASARFKLKTILQHDLERQSPLHPTEVLFTYQILPGDKSAGRLSVSLVMIRRDVVDKAVAGLNALGFKVRHICAFDVHGGREHFLAAPWQGFHWRMAPRHRLAAGLSLLGLIFLAAGLFVTISQQKAHIARLSAAAALLQPDADEARQLQQQVRAAQERISFLGQQRTQPGMGAILAEMTRKLPDGTWLSGFTYNGKEIRIQGNSSNAAALVAILDSSALFSGAQFRAPMVPGPLAGTEQFDLSMNLTGP